MTENTLDEKKYLLYREAKQDPIDSENVSKILKEYLTANLNLSVLLGSGSSILSIPIMGRTFKEYKGSLTANDKENLDYLTDKYKETSAGLRDTEVENIELFLSWLSSRIEGMAQSELVHGEVQIKKELIEKLLSSVKTGYYNEVNETVTNDSGESLPLYRAFISKLVGTRVIADDSHDVVNIFTPNYDLYVEKALDDMGLLLISQ